MPRPKTVNETARVDVFQLKFHLKPDEGMWDEGFNVRPVIPSVATTNIIDITNIGVSGAHVRKGVLSNLCAIRQVTAHVRGNPGDGIPSLSAPMPALNNGAATPTYKFAAFNQRSDAYLYRLYTVDGFANNLWIRGIDDAIIASGATTIATLGGFYSLPVSPPASPTMATTIQGCFDAWIKWVMFHTCHCRPNPAYNGTTVLEKWLTSDWLYAKFDKVTTRKVGSQGWNALKGRAS